MDEHAFDRCTAVVARRRVHPSRRRLLKGGLIGGVFAGVLGVRSGDSAVIRRAVARQDCDLGCTSSICGQIPQDCSLFPKDSFWNTPIDDLPVDARSDDYVASMGLDTGLPPDFGSGLFEGLPLGILFVRVPADQAEVEVAFEVAEESDPGPYPIPADVPIEGGSCGTGDRHIIVVQEEACQLYELYDASPRADGSWQAFSGARYDLTSNGLRPAEWTSADAAGLPILPGLVQYEEIDAGVIPHALRFTGSLTQEAYVWPARHQAGATTDAGVAPMGQRFRLKAGIEIGGFSSGVPDDRWDNDDPHELQERIHGSDFEAIDCSSLIDDPDSGQVA